METFHNVVSWIVKVLRLIGGGAICFGFLCVAILHDLINSIMKAVRK